MGFRKKNVVFDGATECTMYLHEAATLLQTEFLKDRDRAVFFKPFLLTPTLRPIDDKVGAFACVEAAWCVKSHVEEENLT